MFCSPFPIQLPTLGPAVQSVHSRFQSLLPFLAVFAMAAAFLANHGQPTTVEAERIVAAQGSVADVTDAVNPLFVVLLRGWTVLGADLVWSRFLGVLVGLLSLVVAQAVMRGLGGVHAAPGAMALLAASPCFVSVAATVSDAPLTLAAAMACFAAFLEFTKTGRHSWLGVWLITAILCLVTHAGLLLVILLQNVSLLFYGRRQQHHQRFWWSLQLPVAALFLLLHYHQLALLETLGWSLSLSGLPPLASVEGVALVLFLVLCVSGSWSCRNWRRDPRHGLLLATAIVPLLVWLCFPREPVLALSLPALMVLASMGMRLYRSWMRQLLWSGVAVVYAAFYWRMFTGG
jgi:hypothetical protein